MLPEKLVFDSIFEFMRGNNLLSSTQSAFNQTILVLINLFQYVIVFLVYLTLILRLIEVRGVFVKEI